MKDYYQVLRIPRTASSQEIKRAYRRLAVLFHPDKNTSDKALRLFQEINEAHEVLSDPLKRSNYDAMLDGRGIVSPVQEEAPPGGWHRDPAYRRRQQQGYRPPKPGPSEKLLMMLHLLRFLKTAAWVGFIFCAFLLIDYNLDPRVSDERVLPEGNQKITWQLHHEPNVIVTDKGHHFPVPFAGVDYFPEGSQVQVISSKVLNILIQVEAQDDKFIIDSLASIYQNLMFMPILLFAMSVAGLVVKQGIELRFNLLVAIVILLFFNLIFLLFSIL